MQFIVFMKNIIFLFFISSQFYYTHKIVIRFGEYYRPKRMAFFKSTDFGTTYQPWHYYVTPGNNPTVSQQCEDVFTVPEKRIPTSADDVLCTEYPEEIAQEKDQEVKWPVFFL